jgi:glucose/arabinose dehydrogenase
MTAAPTATLSSATLTTSRPYFNFVVTYTGSAALNSSTFDRNDILVIAPDRSRPSVLLGGFTASNHGKTETVTYRMRAIGDTWTTQNNGGYRAYVRDDQVSDNSQQFVAGGFIGHLSINIVNRLTSSIVAGNITVKLALAGMIDTSTDGTPQDLTFAPDDSGRVFIATRNGDIRILKKGKISSTPFLDMAGDGISVYTGGEGGFLGLAFSPNFASNHLFYTLDTEPFSESGPAADFGSPELFPTTNVDPNNVIVVREWHVSRNNVNRAGPTSRVLMRINHPQDNHQGGELRFGADGDLYIGLGDGGGADDRNGSPSNSSDGHNNAIGNGQDLTVPFGKIFRINPDPTPRSGFIVSANSQYSIPDDNPFASTSNGDLKEIFAYGFRNPYRFSFDSATGRLYVGDVGQDSREEEDIVTNGGNYGWPFREGTLDNSAPDGRTTPANFSSIAPIAEYTHSDGNATIGGDIYHGKNKSLDGEYVFGDLAGTVGIGRLFFTSAAGGTISELKYDPSGITPTDPLYGLGVDSASNLYAFFASGQILKIG